MCSFAKSFLAGVLLFAILTSLNGNSWSQESPSAKDAAAEKGYRFDVRFDVELPEPTNGVIQLRNGRFATIGPAGISDESERTLQIVDSLIKEKPDLIGKAIMEVVPDRVEKVRVTSLSRASARVIPGTRGRGWIQPIQAQITVVPNPDLASPEWNNKVAQAIVQSIAKELPAYSVNFYSNQQKQVIAQLDYKIELWEHQKQDVLGQAPPRVSITADSLKELSAEVDRQQLAIRLSLAGTEAREKALLMEIERARARIADKSNNDEMLRKLTELCRVRQEQLTATRSLFQAGVVKPNELADVEASALTAQVELERAKADLRKASGGERIDALAEQLSAIAIDRAELTARLKFLEDAREEYQKLRAEQVDQDRRLDHLHVQSRKYDLDIESATTRRRELAGHQPQPLQIVLPDETPPAR